MAIRQAHGHWAGLAIIEEYDASFLEPLESRVEMDELGNIAITLYAKKMVLCTLSFVTRG